VASTATYIFFTFKDDEEISECRERTWANTVEYAGNLSYFVEYIGRL